jgi:hypothetical protein
MRFPLFIFIFICWWQTGFSQVIPGDDLNSFLDRYNYEKKRELQEIYATYQSIEGTPFLDEEFVKGTAIINDSVQIEDVPLRYDIYRDRIQFMHKEEVILEIDPTQNINFDFGDHLFVIQEYLDDKEKKRGVLELLVDGSVRLYKKYEVVFKPATKPIGFKDAEPDRFERKDDEYLIAIEDGLPEIVQRKNDVYQILKACKPDIEEYAKNNKLKPKPGKGLTQLVEYCNE